MRPRNYGFDVDRLQHCSYNDSTLKNVVRVVMRSPEWDRGVSLAPIVGEVSELVDEHDLGSCAARRPGSSPGFPTNRPASVIDPVTY